MSSREQTAPPSWLACRSGAGENAANTYLSGRKRHTKVASDDLNRSGASKTQGIKMANQNSFFQRALAALVEGRTRQAQRYLAQYERARPESEAKVNKR